MDNKPQKKDNTRTFFAFVLIGIGIIWLLQKAGPVFKIAGLQIQHLFFPFRPAFHELGNLIFSWQVVLIAVGIVLLAGRRPFGIVLIILGGIFLIPKILIFPHIAFSFVIPMLLIGAGVVLIARSRSTQKR
jgi:hypothetical protein